MKCVFNLLSFVLLSLSVHASDKPDDFIDVTQLAPTVKVRMAYAGTSNFVGTVIDGYKANTCYLQHEAAKALAHA